MYKKGLSSWVKHLDFLILDVICLEISYQLAYMCRHGRVWAFDNPIYARLAVMIVILHICTVFFLGSYNDIVKRRYYVEVKEVIKHNVALLLEMLAYMFITKQSALYSRAVYIYMAFISCAIMIVARLVWKRIIRNRIKGRRNQRPILLVVEKGLAKSTISELQKQHYRDFSIEGVAIIDQEALGRTVQGIPVVADQDTLLRYVKDNVVDEVFIRITGREEYVEKLVSYFVSMGLVVHINLLAFTENIKNKEVREFGNFTVLSTSMKFASAGQLFAKRIIDIIGSIVGLVFTAVIFLIFAPVIYKQSPGPIFFAQYRMGRNGRKFRIYKFRSMYLDAEERKKELMEKNKMQGLMFKMDDDPRIIPIGKFMRKTSLDEFPQFFNVLKGEMSLVGTRPPTVDEYEQYELHHKKRLAIKPGLTGLWQVSGRSNIVDFEEVVALDAKYISEWSLGLDVKLLFKTIEVVLKGDGSI